MENKFQTSFIPKKSFDDSGKVRIKTPHNLLSYISVILIVVSIASAICVFAYSFILNRRAEAAKQEVITKEREFNYDAVQDIVDVDNQLISGNILLENHTAISNLFEVLEENTIKNLRFNEFEFTYLSPSRIVLTMKGEASTFGAVARQAEIFSSGSSTKRYFNDAIFSEVDRNEEGDVVFSFLTSINPSLIVYNPDSNFNSNFNSDSDENEEPTPLPDPSLQQ